LAAPLGGPAISRMRGDLKRVMCVETGRVGVWLRGCKREVSSGVGAKRLISRTLAVEASAVKLKMRE
jgi:hypothetical protein